MGERDDGERIEKEERGEEEIEGGERGERERRRKSYAATARNVAGVPIHPCRRRQNNDGRGRRTGIMNFCSFEFDQEVNSRSNFNLVKVLGRLFWSCVAALST